MQNLQTTNKQNVFSDVAKIRNGYAFKKTDFIKSGVPLIKQSNLDGEHIDLSGCVFLPESYLAKYPNFVLKKGDVLLGMSGSLGKLCYYDLDNPSFQNQRTGKIDIIHSEKVTERYFWYFLNTIESKLIGLSKGTGVNNVSATDIESLNIYLPTLEDQNKVTQKLDAYIPKVQVSNKKIKQAKRLLQKFRQSVLSAAVTGKLTEEWRERNPQKETGQELLVRIKSERHKQYLDLLDKAKSENKSKPRKLFSEDFPLISSEDYSEDIPESWIITNVGFLAFVTKLAGFEYTKYIKLSDDGEIPVIRAQNVQMGRFVEENIKYISKKTSDILDRSQLYGREILMVFIGAGTGNVCMAPNGRQWHLAPNVAKIDVDGIDVNYLFYYLQSPIGFHYTMSWMKATAQPSLSMETIRKIIVAVPPLEEQKEIVKRIKSMFELSDLVKKQIEKAGNKADKLIQSILAKAFRGEL